MIALGLLAGVLSGCILAVGNTDVPKGRTFPTLGQELTDLKKARDANAISEEEYQAQRKKLMEERSRKQP